MTSLEVLRQESTHVRPACGPRVDVPRVTAPALGLRPTVARTLGCSILGERSGLIDRTVASVRLPAFLRRTRYRVTVLPDEELSEDERRESEMQRAFRASLRNVQASEDGGPYSCPCCGHRTLPSRGNYDLCPECDWEDDGQDDHDSDVIRGGPNGRLSLDAARAEYRANGGHPEPHVGPARPIARSICLCLQSGSIIAVGVSIALGQYAADGPGHTWSQGRCCTSRLYSQLRCECRQRQPGPAKVILVDARRRCVI